MPAAEAIVATRVVPGALDRRLAATAYDGQQSDDALPPNRPDNLFEPVARDHGAHGRFDAEAKPHSAQLWLTTHRAALALAVVPLLALALARRLLPR